MLFSVEILIVFHRCLCKDLFDLFFFPACVSNSSASISAHEVNILYLEVATWNFLLQSCSVC